MNRFINVWQRLGTLAWVATAMSLLAWGLHAFGPDVGLVDSSQQVFAFLGAVAVAVAGYIGLQVSAYLRRHLHRTQGREDKVFAPLEVAAVAVEPPLDWPRALQKHLAAHHGRFWRHKVRILLVVGDAEHVDAIAPRLTQDRWIEGRDTVWIWGGNLRADFTSSLINDYRRVRPLRPLDGVVWALDTSLSVDANHLAAGMRRLRRLARDLHWSLPLHLWQVRRREGTGPASSPQTVGCLLPVKASLEDVHGGLAQLLPGLVQRGVHQVITEPGNGFYLRLSEDLEAGGIDRWCATLGALPQDLATSVPLRGLWFSWPLERLKTRTPEPWQVEPAWNGVLADDQRIGRWIARHPLRIARHAVAAMGVFWMVGMLVAFALNRTEIAQVDAMLAEVQTASQGDAQVSALNELMHRLARLDQPAPWYQRFGLDTRGVLRDNLWPRYVEANNRLIRDPAAMALTDALESLIRLPPDSPLRAARAQGAYLQLKTYLMMAFPEKADSTVMVDVLTRTEPERAGVTPGGWQYLAPQLWAFYARELPRHPQWRIEADPQLMAQARKVLLTELGQRNGEIALYAQIIEQAGRHYPSMELESMVGDTDVAQLFSASKNVPGVYTRQAWEGHIRSAIDRIANARREQIDWVLSDEQGEVASDLTPEGLKQRLTERYFSEYAVAWQRFMSGLRWRQARDLSESVEQLSLLSDVRQSPLVALVNTLAYQGQAGARTQAITDSLIQSAQQLLGNEKAPAIDQRSQTPAGPLEATFGPLLALVDKDASADPANVSLRGFLNRVSRVRLMLAQITEAQDKQAMTESLAKSIFTGRNEDLFETQGYGRMIASSLGAQWGGVGKTLFVQPLDLAWAQVLRPSAAALNTRWEGAIVRQWQASFEGRYPFAGTSSDASLPLLGQMIRSDSGRIDQFLRDQLAGVLHKEGGRWVVDPRHAQSLKINPDFLTAINQLGHLADMLYTDGGMSLGFELSGKPVKDVVETTFVLDGEKHEYYNQRERWQRFRWPGLSPQPGTRVTWINVFNDNRQTLGDYQGVWGLIRWLELAQVTPLDGGAGRYRLTLPAPDGLGLTWHLRTEAGEGPLTLLKLRGFRLPSQIFLTNPLKT